MATPLDHRVQSGRKGEVGRGQPFNARPGVQYGSENVIRLVPDPPVFAQVTACRIRCQRRGVMQSAGR